MTLTLIYEHMIPDCGLPILFELLFNVITFVYCAAFCLTLPAVVNVYSVPLHLHFTFCSSPILQQQP